MKNTLKLIAFSMVIGIAGCNVEQEQPAPEVNENSSIENHRFPSINTPDEIVIEAPGLYPEGITFDPWKKQFYISSVKKGVISKVDFDGNQTVITEPGDLISTAGMKFLPFRKQVIACNGDAGVSEFTQLETIATVAEVARVKTKSGNQLDFFELSGIYPGPQFINDLTYDWYGNVYITDSFSPVIYKVDRHGNASVFAENPLFAGAPGAFGLNGIVWHPKGFLIVGKYDEAKLFKVSIADPSQVEVIDIDQPIASPDGLLLTSKNTLMMVGNALAPTDAPIGVYKLKTSDNWSSAEVKDIMETPGNFPTTLTKVYKDVYVLFGEIDKLLGGAPDVQEFKIKKVSFDQEYLY